MASEQLWLWFHRRWHEIDQEWLGCPSILVRSARKTLREQVQAYHAHGMTGPYLIPV